MIMVTSTKKWSMSDVQEFWDSVADVYDSQATDKVGIAHERRYSDVLKYFNPVENANVLNVWSRTGRLTAYLLDKFPTIQLTQLELSQKLIAISKKKYPEQYFINSTLDKFPVKSDSYEWVVSLETLEHCPSPKDFLMEINRVLKLDGYLILSCPPATAEPLAYLANKLLGFHGEGPHKFLSSKQVLKLFDEAGFELIEHLGTVLIPFGPDWLQNFGEYVEKFIQKTIVRELCIRQFFFVKKIK